MKRKDIEALLAAREQRGAARPDLVTRLHDAGRLTARERVLTLLDPDSAVEYGSIAAQSSDGEWVAEAGGVDYVGAINGQPVVASSTDYTDHGGGYGAGRLGRLFGIAHERRWPVVLFVDGGGSRAQHPRFGLGHIELSGPIGRFSFLDGLPELSGWVPTVAIVSGPSFAGHASLAGFSDFLVSTPGSSIGMGGPPMVEAALGQRLKPTELAGAEMQEASGGIDLLVPDERAAIAAARQYLGYWRREPIAPATGPTLRSSDVLDEIAPDADAPYDMHQIIAALCDADSTFELRPKFAPNLITALARIGGTTVGVLANQPAVDDGAIDQNAATKIARFVELCNTYEYPMLSLIDTPGTTATWNIKRQPATTEPGITRWHTRALLAHQQRTVPLFSVQLRRARSMGAALMTGVSSSRGVPTMRLGWPNVEVGLRDGYSVALDHNAFDDIILPSETRERLLRLLRLLPTPAATPARSKKKHPIDTW